MSIFGIDLPDAHPMMWPWPDPNTTEIARLKLQLAEVTRERDEARVKLDTAIEDCLDIEKERDQAWHQIESMKQQRDEFARAIVLYERTELVWSDELYEKALAVL
jgi:ABC-type lipoprotein export system ATPase subunit